MCPTQMFPKKRACGAQELAFKVTQLHVFLQSQHDSFVGVGQSFAMVRQHQLQIAEDQDITRLDLVAFLGKRVAPQSYLSPNTFMILEADNTQHF